MRRLGGGVGGDLKPRRLDRPRIRGGLKRLQPIAALDLRVRQFLAGLVRAQRRLARFGAGGDRALDDRLQERVQRRATLDRIGGPDCLRDPFRHCVVRLVQPVRIRLLEPERCRDKRHLAQIRRDVEKQVDRGLRSQLDRKPNDVAAQ